MQILQIVRRLLRQARKQPKRMTDVHPFHPWILYTR